MGLNIRIEKDNDWDVIYFNGDINEDAEVTLADLKSKVTPQCIFNMKGVETVNSCGVRAWVNFMRDAEKNTTIVFDECPPEVVSQINMIPNFKGKAKVRSVYGCYICDECDTEKMVLFKEGENLPEDPEEEIDEVICDKCGEGMEMEELEEEFFNWVSA